MLVIIISIGIIIELDIAKFHWDYSTYKKKDDSHSCRTFVNGWGNQSCMEFHLWVVNWTYVSTLFNRHGFMGINNQWLIINHLNFIFFSWVLLFGFAVFIWWVDERDLRIIFLCKILIKIYCYHLISFFLISRDFRSLDFLDLQNSKF